MGAFNPIVEKTETTETHETDNVILRVTGLVKDFPGVRALDNVSFSLRRGEIHGLVGENGAGKTTLLKILSGVYAADNGEIELEGSKVHLKNPIDAQSKGICMEYQEKTLFPNLSVAENICVGNLGLYSGSRSMVSWKKIHTIANEVLNWLNFDIDTTLNIRDLSPQLQQIVQIARAIALKGKIIILDEPTAAISFSEVDNLFATLRRLKDEGYSIIYVSHHLKEVFRITDRVTILKDGQGVGTFETAALDEKAMTRLMIGRDIIRERQSRDFSTSEVVFETKSLTTADESISDVSVKVRKGEILGIAGLLGSGKDILARVIAGSTPIKSGEVILNGESFVPKRPKQVINKGITVLPAERTLEGLILRQSLNFNMTLSSFKRFSKFGIMNARKDFRLAEKAASDVNLKYVTLRQQALSLSGGNQQRVMIARALLTNAKIIVFNEPTQGVDVGAKQEIHKLIRSYVSRGGSVIIISSELPELLSTSDNIAVMSRGRIVANYTGDEASEETLLKQMIG